MSRITRARMILKTKDNSTDHGKQVARCNFEAEPSPTKDPDENHYNTVASDPKGSPSLAPVGSLSLQVSNQELIDTLEIGKSYYIDLHEAPQKEKTNADTIIE